MRRSGDFWSRYERTAYKPFGEAAARYLREFDGKDKRRTALAIESTLPYIGDTPIIDVNDEALEAYKRDRLTGQGVFERKAMAGTVNKEITVVATVLHRAVKKWDWLPKAMLLSRVKGPTRQPYPLTWEEQDRLFKALPTTWETGCALFAVNTGVRKSELFGLRWSDMVPIPKLETFVFILRETKNGQQRAVICNSIARGAVNKQRGNGSKLVFPSRWHGNKGGRIRQSGKIWAKAWVEAGLPSDPIIRKGIHNLRHTFGHRLRAASVSEEDRAALLGHNNSSLVQHYALPDIERLSEMAEKVTERRETTVLRAVQSSLSGRFENGNDHWKNESGCSSVW